MIDVERYADIGAFAALQIGSRKLLVPQSDLAILELASDVQPSAVPGTVGEINYLGQFCPVFSLTESMALNHQIDRASYLCALLHRGEGEYIGLTCEDVNSVDAEGIQLQSIPVAMESAGQLIGALALDGEEALWITSADRLKSWFENQEMNFDGDD